MSSRDLVGRPLVPFFDADDNVNDALAADASMSFESLDVDARVWNKELGYFEYPSDQTASSSDGSVTTTTTTTQRSQSASRRGKSASTPIAIQPKKAVMSSPSADASGSFGSASRMLLTPAMMLSNSCPDATPAANARDIVLAPPVADGDAIITRNVSAKRATTQETERSDTPARRRNKSKATGKSVSKRGGRSRNNKESSDSDAATVQQQQPQKATKDELSGGGKWAWSAFQSSPDPKQLPLPPFLLNPPAPSHAPSSLPATPFDATAVAHADRPPQPTTPPEIATASHAAGHPSLLPPPPSTVSLEHSMTQDLRRMLNIGGG